MGLREGGLVTVVPAVLFLLPLVLLVANDSTGSAAGRSTEQGSCSGISRLVTNDAAGNATQKAARHRARLRGRSGWSRAV